MSLPGIRLCIVLNLLAIVVYAVYYVILQRRLDAAAVAGLVFYGLTLLALVVSFQRRRRTERQKQWVKELLSGK